MVRFTWRGMPLAGKVQVEWGKEENAHCIANYQLPPESRGIY
ncbi:FimD/PapC C-terminal domain-containing protein [Escherichia coli]